MNNTETHLTDPSLKTIISQDALGSLKLKLSTLYVSAERPNEEPSMYEKFLEFIIDISQCAAPSMYFYEFSLESLFEESFEQNNLSEGKLEAIKTILECVLQENILDSKDLECLWQLMRRNTQACYIVIEALSQSPNNSIKEIFMQNIIYHFLNSPLNQIEHGDYKVMSCMFEICKESDQLFIKQFDPFLQGLSSAPTSDLEFDDFLKKMTHLINEKKLTANNKRHIVSTCAENVGKERLTLISLKLIRKLIESYPNTTEENNGLTKTALVQLLCKEKDLLNKVIREFECLMVKDRKVQGCKSSHANEMIEFITFLMTSIPSGSDIITCNVVISLWKIGLTADDFQDIQGQLFLLTKQIIESKIDNDLNIEELVTFFQEKTSLSKDWNIAKFTKEALDCFRTIFVVVNQHFHNISEVVLITSRGEDFLSRFERLMIGKYGGCLEEDGDFLFQVDTLPNKLEGYTTLWELVLMTEEESVASKAKDLLVYLHTNLNVTLHSQVKEIREEFIKLCFMHLREKPLDKETSMHKIIRCLEVLHSFIDHTSKDNPKRSELHSELCKGESLTISTKRDRVYYTVLGNVIRVTSNTLVSDLLSRFRHEFDIPSLLVYLEEQNSKLIISENQNTRTVGDLGIKNKATLIVKLRALPEAYLIQYNKTLNPQAKLIFTKWFENFSDNQKMSPQQFADFNHGECLPNDRTVVETFAEYDDDKDGYLILDNFLIFYRDACIKRPYVVRNDLRAYNEATDLKPPKKTLELSVDLNVASLISSNKEYIQDLFSLLESEDQIAVKALQLLNRLPTDPQTFVDIVMLKGVRDSFNSDSTNPDWSYVLNIKNIYKLFYCLNIVEYLMESKRLDDNEDESADMKRLWSQNARLSEYKKSWFSDFIACGGFGLLNEVVGKLSLLKTSPTIKTYMARINYLIEAIDKVQTLNMITTLAE